MKKMRAVFLTHTVPNGKMENVLDVLLDHSSVLMDSAQQSIHCVRLGTR